MLRQGVRARVSRGVGMVTSMRAITQCAGRVTRPRGRYPSGRGGRREDGSTGRAGRLFSAIIAVLGRVKLKKADLVLEAGGMRGQVAGGAGELVAGRGVLLHDLLQLAHAGVD